jgi:ElaA protein
MNLTELCKPFQSLTLNELYDCLRLRSDIFVVEQKCIFLDADNIDQKCEHLMLLNNKEIVAYARIVPPGVSYKEASIGRVVSSKQCRGKGYGKLLMDLAINNCRRLHPSHDIKIGAQLYLKSFYESFGFVPSGEVYDEDGIDHILMIKVNLIRQR